jgi:O-antigen/teichoic acid export membrane protein
MVPAGLLIVGLLTRGLGPDGYGSFAISASLIVGIEWALASVLSRSTIHGVSQTEDWRPVARTLLHWHLTLGIAVLLVLWTIARPLAALLHEPTFALHITVLACDIPFFMVGQAYRNILTGRGSFALRALTGASRWFSRLAFTVIAVQMGISILAVIATCIGASIVELAVGRLSLGSLKTPETHNSTALVRLAASLMVSTLSIAIIGKMDLFIIKTLGWPAQQAGFYAAAQNLALMPGIFGQAISAVVLSTLTRINADKQMVIFRKVAQQSLHAGLCLVPIIGVVAGGATEIAILCFGATFQSAATFLPLLFMGAVAQVVFSLIMATLTAGGHAGLTALLAAPLVFIALAGHLWSIPLWGPLGAAWTTALTMLVGAVGAYVAMRRLLFVRLCFASLVRAVTLSVIGWVAIINTPPDPLWRLSGIGVFSIILVALLAWQESLISRSIFSTWRQGWQGEQQA